MDQAATPLTEVRIPIGGSGWIAGDLIVPAAPCGIVVFVHGSGSSRHSPRNRRVAAQLGERRLATLLADLLTPEEARLDDQTGLYRFDIPRLAARVEKTIDWLDRHEVSSLPIGLFGASTGAAAALVAASERPLRVAAVVSRGGRPDLAGAALAHVTAPTLLIVGGRDTDVLALNRDAEARMPGEVTLEIVPDASHLFEEPGALDRVAILAGEWFRRHLQPRENA